MRRWPLAGFILLCAVCARAGESVPGAFARYSAIGMSSWYGGSFHGGRTANGERFDMQSISAAHKTLPLPCYARVTNLRNGHSLVVRVNDRGPYIRGRMLDVSAKAASLLGFRGEGMARVKIEYLGKAQPAGTDEKFLLASLRTGSEPPPEEAPLAFAVAATSGPIEGSALAALVSASRAANDDARSGTPERSSPFGDLSRSPFLEVLARN